MTFLNSQQAYAQSVGTTSTFAPVIQTRNPTSSDVNYKIGQEWINTVNQTFWFLNNQTSPGGVLSSTWVQIAGSSSTLSTLTGNSGGTVSPTAGNINTLGAGSITIVGTPGTSTLTTELTGLTNHNVLVGAGTTTITNVPPSTAGFVLTSNGASADPSFQSISASGAILTITGNTGGAESPNGSGNFNIVGTGSITVAGSANTETVQLTGLTNNAIQVGAGTASLTQLGPVNQAVLTTGTSGIPALTSLAGNGELIIGSTAGAPAAATLTAGTGISITNGSNSITIACTGSVMAWTDEGLSFNAVSGNGYFITAVATATLPASPSQGDEIDFIVDTTSQLTIQANTGQIIRIGAAVSAASGMATNNARGDAVTLVYRSSDTTWLAYSVIGTWTVT